MKLEMHQHIRTFRADYLLGASWIQGAEHPTLERAQADISEWKKLFTVDFQMRIMAYRKTEYYVVAP